MRRHAAVRVDFVGRKRHDGRFEVGARRAFQTRQEEPRITGQLFDVAVRGHHDEHHFVAGIARGSAGNPKRFGSRCEAGHFRARGETRAHEYAAQQLLELQ